MGIESPGSLLQVLKYFSHNLYLFCHFAHITSFYGFPSWVSDISILLLSYAALFWDCCCYFYSYYCF